MLTRPATVLALTLGVVLPLVELARIALIADAPTVAAAVICTSVFLPAHVWHLRFGLRGCKPPHAGWTLTAMVLANVAGGVLVGSAWALMLASLASSILIVVDVPWAVLLLAGVTVGAYGLGGIGSDAVTGRTGVYVVASVAFRSVTLFVLVWFSAAVCQLAAARSSIAAAVASRERRRADGELTALAHDVGMIMVERTQRARTELARVSNGVADEVLGAVADQARHALTRVRALARDLREGPTSGSEASEALTLTSAGPASPVERALADARHSRRVLLAVHVPMLVFLIANATTGLGVPGASRPSALLAVPAGLALGAVQLRVSFATSTRRPPRHGLALLAAAWALALGPAIAFGYIWSPAAWFVAATGALVLPGAAARLIAFALPIGLWILSEVVRQAPDARGPVELAYVGVYVATVGFTGAAGLVAAARLAPVVSSLVAARRAQAAQAGDQERRRISRDLHDLLGQTLSALALKAELARRRLGADPEAARREVGDLIELAADLMRQIDAVVDADSGLALADELRNGTQLLRSAGAQVDVRLEGTDDLAAHVDALLAWSLREAITNVLRHSRPRHCAITVRCSGERARLEIVNDGVAPGIAAGGRGLDNLEERVRAAGGALQASPTGDGHFRLLAEVPHPVAAQVPEAIL